MNETKPQEKQGRLTASDYQFALDSQSACNLSGIVHALSRVISKISFEAREKGEGTDYVNQHPICRLYAEQITHLTGAGLSDENNSYYEAHRMCEQRAAE